MVAQTGFEPLVACVAAALLAENQPLLRKVRAGDPQAPWDVLAGQVAC